ncbi:MAG: Na/Pi cotransporter family protein [Gammaproteobacteria bacterium]|nr:Na/Pi cotransporter family protein [Gammaproteobacteria bacterium]
MDFGFTDLLTLLGSLGLFLYGMKVMSDSLMMLAGNQMRSILATTTSNRFFALLTGFLITAAIQSSSATTLMVVSFVNASLLTLTEAVGVIMGANIGTTVTAWLITILGFKVKMSAIALPLVGAGFLLTISKSEKARQWGYFTVGFALLFIGLQFLKDSVPNIGDNPEALAFLAEYTSRGFLSVLMFLVIGAILTLVIQSSSAAMALTLLMCFEGWIAFDIAAAMVVGQNIGTTITANLAAIIGNYHAKRAARAHLIFNVFGAVWILILFYPFLDTVGQAVEQIEGISPFLSAAAIPIAISIFHTVFNILNAIVLIGFIKIIVNLAIRMVPAVEEKEVEIDQPQFLTESSLKYSQTGIKALTDESVRLLGNAAYKVFAHGLGVHRHDLESEQDIHKLLDISPRTIKIDIDLVYATQIKIIYSRILEYATKLQKLTKPTQQQIETIRNILVADRLLVQTVKRMKPLQENLERYMQSDNETLRREYNVLRRRILKVVREIKRIGPAENLANHLERIEKQRSKAEQMDVLLTGHIEELLATDAVTDEMASSLINDSSNAARITINLIDIAMILYKPQDKLINSIDDRNAEQYHP